MIGRKFVGWAKRSVPIITLSSPPGPMGTLRFAHPTTEEQELKAAA